MKIQENLSLKAFNTFGIDKKAQFFTRATTIEELKEALTWAKERGLPLVILGGGSNILLTRDVLGLVIKVELQGIEVIQEDENQVLVEVGAGVVWHDWVVYCLEKNWAGVENLSLIPGTVGASPMQNIGAYGVEIKDVFHSLKALNRNTQDLEAFDASACKFGYRESIFKHESKDQYIITSVSFRLSKNPEFQVAYGAIQDVLKEKGIKKLSIQAISEAVIEIRQSKLPDPKELGNAGSFFKNPTIPISQFEMLKTSFPTLPGYEVAEGIKVPAGWLIEQSGWKGKRIGEVGVHAKQALVLVNYGRGTGEEIKSLSEQVRASVRDQFGIELNPEVNFV
ncbi:MAG: UDP-N-acetylmuramate dehydrogenase [Algoriphagus sp.]|jgi:UDP-N-acetylmuramate dehydrogenase|nr:UDP-N-acetylmuramate dehydrogenase [Algoriphagus sp.]